MGGQVGHANSEQRAYTSTEAETIGGREAKERRQGGVRDKAGKKNGLHWKHAAEIYITEEVERAEIKGQKIRAHGTQRTCKRGDKNSFLTVFGWRGQTACR